MSEAEKEPRTLVIADDRWTWWQSRRLRYNLALAGSGALAYAITGLLYAAFGAAMWSTWNEALSQTLFLGVGFLVLMGVANLLYLLGPLGESFVRRTEIPRYRDNAYAMGFWGSVALPFAFPLLNLSMLLS
ncbi:MAG: hypothetical protein KIS96_12970 [Bauldia sp.]|nr:hypothetical protein [Bauldia sp.]